MSHTRAALARGGDVTSERRASLRSLTSRWISMKNGRKSQSHRHASGGSGLSHTQVTIKHHVCCGSERERHFTHFWRSLEKVCDQRESRSSITDDRSSLCSHGYESQALHVFISVCLYSYPTQQLCAHRAGRWRCSCGAFPRFPWFVFTLSVCLSR